MIIGTPELIAQRREEIMNACAELYETQNFHDITLKEIGTKTSCSSPTIYNYFQTKEEIFLALFEREYEMWTEDLQKLADKAAGIKREKLAEALAVSLQKRILLLKLLSVNLYDMEENSRMERLVSFKKTYGKSRDALLQVFQNAFPGMTKAEQKKILFTFLPFLHGVYPYAIATQKQIEAMDEAGIKPPGYSIKQLVKQQLLFVLPK